MKTDDLITALAKDNQVPQAPQAAITGAFAVALLFTATVFAMLLGVRPGLVHLLGDWRFVMKFVVLVPLIALAARALVRLANPAEPASRALEPMLLAPGLLLAAVAAELVTTPQAEWAQLAIGHNALVCVTVIPALSLMPLAVFLYAARNGAPASPALAGGIAGVLSAALGAAFYASFCDNDSPLYVALWYSIAFAIMAAMGAILGRRLLRW